MLLPKTPFSRHNHAGVSINSTSLEIIVISQDGKMSAASHKEFSQLITLGKPEYNQVISTTIKQAVSEIGLPIKYAAVGIPEKVAYSRIYTLPRLNTSDITEAISWQIEKIFPFSASEVYTDWKLRKQTKANTEVMVTVIPKEILDQLKNAFLAAGIFPVSFEPSASAISHLLDKNQDLQVLTELNQATASVSLLAQGISVLTSTLNYPPNADSNQVFQSVSSSITALLHHSAKDHDTSQVTITLTGQRATDQAVAFLKSSLNLETKLLTIDGTTPAQHIAYSMASQQIAPPKSPKTLNLLPTNFQEYYQAQIDHATARRALQYVIALSVIAVCIPLSVLIMTIVHKNSLKSQLAEAKATPAVVGSAQLNLAQVQKKAQRLNKLFPAKTSPEEPVKALLAIIPQGISIQSINYNTRSATLEVVAVAQSRDTLLQFQSAIDDQESFSAPIIPLSALKDFQDQEFTLTIKYDPKA